VALAVKEAGGEPILLAPEKDTVRTVNHDTEPAESFEPDHAVGDVSRPTLPGWSCLAASPIPTSCA
jgi:hypothetical protein